MAKVVVIGGGIVGLSSALYLRRAGHHVTVIDQGKLQEGCSFGNAGMIVPSHIIPLAAPGMVEKGFRWMFRSTSPFYVRPRLSLELLQWGLKFMGKANAAHVAKSIPALRDLSFYSKQVYREWDAEKAFEFGYLERGLMMLYQTAGAEHEEQEVAEVANKAGVEARVLNLAQVQELEPEVRVQARGGVYYPGDAQMDPANVMNGLLGELKKKGVELWGEREVTGFEKRGHHVVRVNTTSGEVEADQVVLAAGAWSAGVGRQLGLGMPMQAGKGYSFTLTNVVKNVRIPTIFLEARVAVTPIGSSLRFGGTMEIAGNDPTINMNRVRGIVESIPKYYPEMKVSMPAKETVWHGLRPCSPDGLPYIGRLRKVDNVVVATGHAMMGMSLGPGTGKVVADIVDGKVPGVDLAMFDPERYA